MGFHFWPVSVLAVLLAGSIAALARAMDSDFAPVQQGTPQPMSLSPRHTAIYPVENVTIVDGDSFRARVPLWPGQELTTLVRIRGIDAPEKKARCSGERVLAKKAEAMLQELALEGLAITDLKLDKYGGRILATVLLPDGSSVAEHLIALGTARGYEGKTRQSWCVKEG
jgi:micrococcal nuclease